MRGSLHLSMGKYAAIELKGVCSFCPEAGSNGLYFHRDFNCKKLQALAESVTNE
ncbi:MAG: hypothetical protein OXE78_04545 [Gammaproteobacteria bacterium]|nr:hypothetical protein [Gammaproteobacteria bacterium]